MKKILILLFVFVPVAQFLYSQGFEVIEEIAPMNFTRIGHASVSLPYGKVLVAGGHTQGFEITSTAEIFDPLTGNWTLYNIDNPHDGCSFVQLADGRFMFYSGFSGWGSTGQSTVTTLFDPATSEFTNGPLMNVARAFSAAVRIADNRIIIVANWCNVEKKQSSNHRLQEWSECVKQNETGRWG